uniref:Winged helix-turn-helix transcriptional regulator n=1 Tax=Staphylothermus marinus TaxID=2280 RepID=A0A7C4D797_STAMA
MKNRLMKPYIKTFILFIIVYHVYVSIVSSSYTINLINISINVLSIEEENILVTQTVLLSNSGSKEIHIPLISSTYELNYSIISIIDDQNRRYEGSVVNGNLVLNIIDSQQLVLTIRYSVSGLIEEITPFIYTLILDTTGFENITYNLSINIPRHYNVTPLYPSNLKIMISGNWYVIDIDVPHIYVILIEIPSEYSSKPTGYVVSKPLGLMNLLVLITAVLAVVLVSLYFLKFRSKGIEVETIPSNIMSDDTSRAIITYIGDKGGEIKQSELALVINRPKSIISRRIKRLAEEGYLVVMPRGKYNIVKLTDRGWKTYRELKKG